MEMTKAEICARYKNADKKEEKIKILAQLNDCSEGKIREILKEGGEISDPVEKNEERKAVHEQEVITKEAAGLDEKHRKIPNFVITALYGELDRLEKEIKEKEDMYRKISNYLKTET